MESSERVRGLDQWSKEVENNEVCDLKREVCVFCVYIYIAEVKHRALFNCGELCGIYRLVKVFEESG